MTIASNYNAAGLASNIDWSSMVDKLVQLESAPITEMQKNQAAVLSQVSTLGSVASKVSALQAAADNLAKSGVLKVNTTSSNTSFSVTPGSGAAAGRYTLQIGSLAQAAKAHSATFGPSDSLAGGTLDLTVMGKSYSVNLTDGESLGNVASAIRATGAPVTVTVLNDGTNQTLSFTNNDTGYPTGTQASDALVVSHHSDGNGKSLDVTPFQQAQNATLTLDGVTITRQSNVISDAVPGTTITLKTPNAPAEDLILENDVAGTATKIQSFVDAYNGVIRMVQSQLDVTKDTDRTTTLAGDGTMRALQSSLQNLMVSKVGSSDVRTLADIGIATARDGTISLNQGTLATAIARNPTAVNALFTDATSGLGALTDSMAKLYNDPVQGALVTRQSSLNSTVSDMTDQMAQMQLRIDSYRQTLIQQFTAMERVISNLKASASFLTQSQSSSSRG